jgi:diadenosine tetraphosphate (Ap4A) HIT family hydrolase
MDDADCPFCRTLATLRTRPEKVVWQFPQSLALLGSWQYYQGYCVLVARRHARELSELASTECRAYLDEMCLLARAIQQAFRPHKLNYELLGNQVPHLHWHLFPRSAEDPDRLRPVWFALDRAEREQVEAGRLRSGALRDEAVINALREKLRALGAPRDSDFVAPST